MTTATKPLKYEQIKEFREKLFKEIDENSDEYYSEDISRLKTDDWICQRFLLHQRSCTDKAVNMAKNDLKWRKEMGVKDITKETLPEFLFQQECVYPCSKDKWGRTLMVIQVKNLRKNTAEEKSCMEKFMIYWVEKIDKENNGAGISVLIDCTGAGLSNANLEVVQYSKYLFTYHYPKTLGYFLVYNMPWIFSAIWSLIQSWLPKYVVNIIKFVDKNSILEYVDQADLPTDMGGTVLKSKCLVNIPVQTTAQA